MDPERQAFYDAAMKRREQWVQRRKGGKMLTDDNAQVQALKAKHDELAAWAEADIARRPVSEQIKIRGMARAMPSQIAVKARAQFSPVEQALAERRLERRQRRRQLSRDDVMERLERIRDILDLLP